MSRVGILGGTFNPIHAGHLMLAEWALDEIELDEVWIIPTGVSYLKKAGDIVPGEDRLRMAELAAAENERFKCLDLEIVKKGDTYSYQTLEQLCEQYPQNEFFFLVGADCLYTIEMWKRPDRIFQQCTLVAAVRNDASLSEMEAKKVELEERFHGRIILLSFLRMAISSTEIRQRIKYGRSIRYLVPDKVLSYIKEKGLYQDENC